MFLFRLLKEILVNKVGYSIQNIQFTAKHPAHSLYCFYCTAIHENSEVSEESLHLVTEQIIATLDSATQSLVSYRHSARSPHQRLEPVSQAGQERLGGQVLYMYRCQFQGERQTIQAGADFGAPPGLPRWGGGARRVSLFSPPAEGPPSPLT